MLYLTQLWCCAELDCAVLLCSELCQTRSGCAGFGGLLQVMSWVLVLASTRQGYANES